MDAKQEKDMEDWFEEGRDMADEKEGNAWFFWFVIIMVGAVVAGAAFIRLLISLI